MDEMQVIRIRYWAAARSAAGVAEETVDLPTPVTLAGVREELFRRHRDSRLTEVIAVCSVLVDDRPASSVDPHDVPIAPGSTVEFLPPFAGG